MNIELYSIKSYTTNALKHQLEDALAELSLPYLVKEINNVDEFIRAGLTSVPALKIGSKVIEHHDEVPFEATVQQAMEYILSEHEKLILVPVDFSPESIHAMRYARMIASTLKMGLTVVHVHQPILDPITGMALDYELAEMTRKKLAEMVIGIGWDQYRVGEHVPINTHFETGDIRTHLLSLAADDKYDMILMSTKAEDSFMKRLLGSVSTYVSRIGPKPVIVIPPNTPLTFPRKITVGLTEDLLKSNALQFLIEFASRYMIYLDFVQVTNDHHAFWELKNKISEKINYFPSELCGIKICSIPFLEGRVHESLSDYAISARSNMLVLVTKQRNLIDSLMHTSVTRKALLNPKLPIMVLQADRETRSQPIPLNGTLTKGKTS